MRISLPLLSIALLAACSSFDPLPLSDEEGEPVRVTGTNPLPDREVLLYDGFFSGIPGGESELEFHRAGAVIESRARLRTGGFVSLLYGAEIAMSAETAAKTLSSLSFRFLAEDSSGQREVRATFSPDGGIHTRLRKPSGNVSTTTLVEPDARDPLSMILTLRQADLAPGDRLRMDLFTEWYIYRTFGLVTGRERLRGPSGAVEALVIRLQSHKVVDGRVAEGSQGAAIWLTDDDERIPIRIEADSPFGRIRLELTSYQTGWPAVSAGRGAGK